MALERDNACIQKYVPDNNEFKILEQLSLLLQPLKEITTIFSGRSYNTISLLYPSIHYLINGGLKEVSLSNPMILNLRENLESSLRTRFRYLFNNEIFIAATFLNYKYRKFEFVRDDHERINLLKKCKQYIKSKFEIGNEDSTPIQSAQQVSSRNPLDDISDIVHNSSR